MDGSTAGPGSDKSKSGKLSKAFLRMNGVSQGRNIATRSHLLHDAQLFLHNRRPGARSKGVVSSRAPET
ncbi:hypothetical protein RI820_000294 [Pluralibacter gergoviae]|uniref:hypothetical protein n=1 Tax=Pluralibacter gergoviae TaxID=61647 RepID=UPI00155F36C5|nr:hypothetical protein [Pluralibacter gergoviae]ELC3015457.1 hypothetical protein [Pluralibacter gergoviae]ELC3020436.1 hypothetical protein [Pluralibacter gergoviae]